MTEGPQYGDGSTSVLEVGVIDPSYDVRPVRRQPGVPAIMTMPDATFEEVADDGIVRGDNSDGHSSASPGTRTPP